MAGASYAISIGWNPGRAPWRLKVSAFRESARRLGVRSAQRADGPDRSPLVVCASGPAMAVELDRTLAVRVGPWRRHRPGGRDRHAEPAGPSQARRRDAALDPRQ